MTKEALVVPAFKHQSTKTLVLISPVYMDTAD